MRFIIRYLYRIICFIITFIADPRRYNNIVGFEDFSSGAFSNRFFHLAYLASAPIYIFIYHHIRLDHYDFSSPETLQAGGWFAPPPHFVSKTQRIDFTLQTGPGTCVREKMSKTSNRKYSRGTGDRPRRRKRESKEVLADLSCEIIANAYRLLESCVRLRFFALSASVRRGVYKE